MRIGLFGGTFDPVHLGHLRTVLEVREVLGLERVYLIPSATPPHKVTRPVSDPALRLEMLRAAVAGDDGFMVSDVELRRAGPSYTIDTVRQFEADLGHPPHLIMGLDAFLELDTWKSYLDLVARVSLVVMLRPAGDGAAGVDGMDGIRRFVDDRIAPGYRFSPGRLRFDHPGRAPIRLMHVTALGISSTRIRDLVRQGKSIRFLVPDPVERMS